ncbi:hypothetical protein WGM54_26260 [Paenibacillus polymyxa]|uniref:hypothetical protein n=1 Tax=Paenibacillus polymyxa TaxID=1406 RepID=UPI00307E0A9C
MGILHEVVVTIDGTKTIHDSRRYLYNGMGSFDTIMQELQAISGDSCFEKITIRINVDTQNIDSLEELISHFNSLGWLIHGLKIKLYKVEDKKGTLKNIKEINESLLLKKFLNLKERFIEVSNLSNIIKVLEANSIVLPHLRVCKMDHQFVFDEKGEIYNCSEALGDEEFIIEHYEPQFEEMGEKGKRIYPKPYR